MKAIKETRCKTPKVLCKEREDDHGGAGNGQGGGRGRPPHHVRGCGGMGGPGSACRCGGIREYDPDPPRPPNILNQLVATLHDASLQANPHATAGIDQM